MSTDKKELIRLGSAIHDLNNYLYKFRDPKLYDPQVGALVYAGLVAFDKAYTLAITPRRS